MTLARFPLCSPVIIQSEENYSIVYSAKGFKTCPTRLQLPHLQDETHLAALWMYENYVDGLSIETEHTTASAFVRKTQ